LLDRRQISLYRQPRQAAQLERKGRNVKEIKTNGKARREAHSMEHDAKRAETPGTRVRGSSGFSLIELLIVLAIVGMIVSLVGPKLLNYLEGARVKTTRLQIDNFSKTLDLYFLDNGRYPTSAEGLDALIHQPAAAASWRGPYLKSEKLPPDPWGATYNYRSPGEHGKFDIYSYGSDGREGGSGDAADVTSW
jgi:general secretion pathway protein G